MPVNFPCTKCRKACKKVVEIGDESICCDECNKWVHYKCTNLSNEELELYEMSDKKFTCDRCLSTCLICKKYCKINQKAIVCYQCKHQIHARCRHPNFGYFSNIDPERFFCHDCSLTHPNEPIPEFDQSISSINSSFEFSSAHDSDFDFITDSEDDLRGLNFDALPAQNTVPISILTKGIHSKSIPARIINYKYPCSQCKKPCKEKVQDSICCTICDEWVHQSCSRLTLAELKVHCSPDYISIPFYCNNCLNCYASASETPTS